jgi:ABC-type Fe3+-hydroxamate transport system, periplasmic component
MKKRILSLFLALALLLALAACAAKTETLAPSEAPAPAPATTAPTPTADAPAPGSEAPVPETEAPGASSGVVVTDGCGRQVEVPANPQRIAALYGPSFEGCLLFGHAEDVIITMSGAMTNWAKVVFPGAENFQLVQNAREPNLEELTAQEVDLVLFWAIREKLDAMENAGLTAVAVKLDDPEWDDIAGYVAAVEAEVDTYGYVLNADQEEIDRWNDYFEAKVNYVVERVSTIPKEEWPDVYYIRSASGDGLEAYFKHHGAEGELMIAGGNMVTKNVVSSDIFGTVTMEDVIAWDPDIILLGRTTNTEMITNNDAWAGITAVKNDEIYVGPNGVFYWDSSSERVLNILWLAKVLHPDLFQDLDLEAEVKEYYSTFYGYDLTDEQARDLLNSAMNKDYKNG